MVDDGTFQPTEDLFPLKVPECKKRHWDGLVFGALLWDSGSSSLSASVSPLGFYSCSL